MYPSRQQYGLASVPAGITALPSGMGGVPAGLAIPSGVSGMPAGMTALPSGGMAPSMPAGVSGMPAMYASEKPAGLYTGASPTYRLPQGSYLAQPGSAQASYLTSAQQPGYLAVSSPVGQPRYMTMSQAYPVSTVGATPSLYQGQPGYSLSAGYYSPSVTSALSVQPTSITESSRLSSTSSPATSTQSTYPTYIGTQLGPVQISPSQNPYAAAATGHPLYPSPLTSLQVQTQQSPMAGLPGQIPGRVAPLGTATAYPSMAYPAHATSPTIPGASFYPSY